MPRTDVNSDSERLGRVVLELGALQRTLRSRRIPAIVLVGGWNASGISDTVAALLRGLDPRGFDFHAFGRPDEEDRSHIFLRRFWVRTPPGAGSRSSHAPGTRGPWTKN